MANTVRPFAAIIPIKDHSERVPGKNFRVLGDRPLWEHVVRTLSEVESISAIFIDTDSARFTSEALAPYPKVELIERPEELRGDFVSTNRIFEYDLTRIDSEFDRFIQTHTTNPLLTAETIGRAIEAFEAGLEAGTSDSLFSATAYHARFFRRDGSPINHDPDELLRTQDLDPVLEENSNIYIFSRDSFAWKRRRIGRNPILFEMDRTEATDIDDEQTWQLAEALLAARGKTR